MDAREEALDLLHKVWAKLQGLSDANPMDLGAFLILILFVVTFLLLMVVSCIHCCGCCNCCNCGETEVPGIPNRASLKTRVLTLKDDSADSV